MMALLDTHTFSWAISADRRLSRRAGRLFVGPSDLWFSVANIWEIPIKVQAGKMPLPAPAGPYIVKKLLDNRIETLPVTLDHVLGVEALPMHHADPFDRILVAHCIEESLPLVSADQRFEKYSVELLW
jgi:PIN domain nuclease of toxin-antitoxin system